MGRAKGIWTLVIATLATAMLMTPKDAHAADPLRPGLIGVGLNNSTSVIGGGLGLTAPVPAATMKYHINHDNAITVDAGFSVLAGPAEGRVLIFGAGYERNFHTFEHSHFFGRFAGHFANYEIGAGGVLAGEGSAANIGIYAGWEYIFDKGLPGLGISAELGANIFMLFPDGGETTVNFTFGGLGAGAGFENLLLLGVRYYFMP